MNKFNERLLFIYKCKIYLRKGFPSKIGKVERRREVFFHLMKERNTYGNSANKFRIKIER